MTVSCTVRVFLLCYDSWGKVMKGNGLLWWAPLTSSCWTNNIGEPTITEAIHTSPAGCRHTKHLQTQTICRERLTLYTGNTDWYIQRQGKSSRETCACLKYLTSKLCRVSTRFLHVSTFSTPKVWEHIQYSPRYIVVSYIVLSLTLLFQVLKKI